MNCNNQQFYDVCHKGYMGFQRRNSGGNSRGGLENFRGEVPTRDEDEKVKTRLQRRNSQQNSGEVYITGGNLTTPYTGPL